MNKDACIKEKISSRTVGLMILPFGLLLAFASFFFLPIVGIVFALPVLLFSGVLVVAPESRVCRLLIGQRP